MLYNVAATQRANAAEGPTFASIRLDDDAGRLTMIPADRAAVECHVDYSSSSRDALRDVLAAQGIPLRAAPPDDGTYGMPLDDDPPLLQHAWILKMIGYGVDPWITYPRSWTGDLLGVRLAHQSTDAIFRIDGVVPLVTINVSYGEASSNIALNYSIVDNIKRLVDEGANPPCVFDADGTRKDPFSVTIGRCSMACHFLPRHVLSPGRRKALDGSGLSYRWFVDMGLMSQ